MEIFLDSNFTNSKILFVGEGNFSFSRYLIENVKNDFSNIIATCYEPESSLSESTKDNVTALIDHGVKVEFGVDATKLEEKFREIKWDKIIFMFPHIGGKMKIQKNRELLKNFAQSVQKVLAKNGSVIVALCDGQGGTPYDKCQRLEADSWQILKMMAFGSFGLTKVSKFNLEQYPGYRAYGYRSMDKGFHVDQGTIHVFQSFPSIDEIDFEGNKLEMFCAPEYKHDLSFWMPKGQIELPEEHFQDIIKKFGKQSVIAIDLIDKYFSDEKELQSFTYKLTYCNTRFVIDPVKVMGLHYAIGNELENVLKVKIR